ncbi:MAG: helix-turn-helix transcriptional regulator [Acidobacteria bacterium]|nr:helix-turn-helix transcriptional regulator [Acidobacteriota bacterium]MCB9398557.1 helix-turn-helix transcriptional regulator [Acidobacteriota bacterium]
MNFESVKKRFLPMTETAFYVLLCLLEERHGYAIMQEVERLTDGRMSLGAGTLYGTLGKMEKAGLIRTTKEEARRKYYRVTEWGENLIREEANRLKQLVTHAEIKEIL